MGCSVSRNREPDTAYGNTSVGQGTPAPENVAYAGVMGGGVGSGSGSFGQWWYREVMLCNETGEGIEILLIAVPDQDGLMMKEVEAMKNGPEWRVRGVMEAVERKYPKHTFEQAMSAGSEPITTRVPPGCSGFCLWAYPANDPISRMYGNIYLEKGYKALVQPGTLKVRK